MNERVARLHRDAPLTDLHAHPSLKAFLFRRNLWRHYHSGSAFNPFSSRSDFKMLAAGGVRTLWASHHLPERQLFEDCAFLALAALLATTAYTKLRTGSPWERLLEMMDAFEREAARRPDAIGIARRTADVDRLHREGRIALVQTVEGAHALEGRPERLSTLAQRGVASLTLNHFYHNGICAQVDALPQDFFVRRVCSFRFGSDDAPVLTALGRELLRVATDERITIDVTHCSPEARAIVFSEVNGERPLIASHVGVRARFPDPYNLSDDELAEIAGGGGLIGVIAMPYWLDGGKPGDGLESMLDTIEHVARVTGSWHHVAIGSDFDGFTHPPERLPNASQFGALTQGLLDRGVSEADILGVLGRNADRVLRAAWR